MVAVVATRTSSGDAVDRHLELAVLGAAALDDVHVRHDLDAADQRGAHVDRQREHLVQRAVDPVADAQPVVHRLDVHVRRARSMTACERIRFTTWTTGAFWSTVWPTVSSTCCSARRASVRASNTRTCSPTRDVALYATSIARRTSETPPT